MSDTVTPETLDDAVKAAQVVPVDVMGVHRYASPLREQIEASAPVLLAPVLARLEEAEAQLAAVRNALENADSDMEAPELLDVIHGALSALGGSNG